MFLNEKNVKGDMNAGLKQKKIEIDVKCSVFSREPY